METSDQSPIHLKQLTQLSIPLLGPLGLYNVIHSAFKLLPPDIYSKDFLQEYLIGRAVRSGVNPYLPLSHLAARFVGALPVEIFPNASPHPPPVVFLALPLSLFTYQHAAVLWLVIEVFCSVLAIRLLARQFEIAGLYSVLIALAVFTWNPFYQEFAVGQLSALLLLLLAYAWLALRSHRDIAGGLALGLCLALKLTGWPIIFFLLWKKRWRAVISSGMIVGGLNLGALALIGWQALSFYYLYVPASVAQMYRNDAQNFSAWTIGWKLFQGTGTSEIVYSAVHAPAIYYSPSIAQYVSVLCVVALLVYSLFLAQRTRSFDRAYAVLVCCSVVINPAAWYPYLIILLIPLFISFNYLQGARLYGLLAMLFSVHLSIPLAMLLPNFVATVGTFVPLIVIVVFMSLLGDREHVVNN